MTVLITLTTVGADSGPTYNLYSSPDGTTFTPFATGITKLALLAGYPDTVPDGTTTIRVTSIGTLCTNSKDLTVGVVPSTTTTSTTALSPIITGNICGTWQSDAQLNGEWENLTSGSVNFTSVLQLGELISTTEGFTSIQLNSYKSINTNVYDVTGTVLLTVFDGYNGVDFSFTKFQNLDDTPVDTLYFTGTIYTNYGRTLIVDVTSQYEIFVPGSPGGGTSYAQPCQTNTTTTTTTTTAAPFNPEIILSWTVSGNAADACALYGDPGSEVTYYVDDIWFIAYGLFQDPAMTIPAPAAMYSDGNYSRYWDGSSFVGSPVAC